MPITVDAICLSVEPRAPAVTDLTIMMRDTDVRRRPVYIAISGACRHGGLVPALPAVLAETSTKQLDRLPLDHRPTASVRPWL